MLEAVECVRRGEKDRYPDDCRQITMFKTERGQEFSRTEAYAQCRAIPGYLFIRTDDGEIVELQPAEKDGVRYVRALPDEDGEDDPLLDVDECPMGTFLNRGERAEATVG